MLLLAGCGIQRGNLAEAGFRSPPPPESSLDVGASPPSLAKLRELKAEPLPEGEEDERLLSRAMREQALTLGAQGGLAWRTWQISRMLKSQADALADVYAFRRMMIPAPSGAIVAPPVVTESRRHYRVAPGGQTATAADRVYRIVQPARLVSTPPNWREYLIRSWEGPELPPGELLPQTQTQRKVWRRHVTQGWRNGVAQADAIFESDLNRLERDIQGMARYRALVAQGVIDQIYLAKAERGITGGGDVMRVGDRVVRITSPARLNARDRDWRPVVIAPRIGGSGRIPDR